MLARTTQALQLANGQQVKPGAEVLGHVVAVQPFVFDKTPYAKQTAAVLTIPFDTLIAQSEKIPLHVYVRALADIFATTAAVEPRPSEDPLHSTTQVGAIS